MLIVPRPVSVSCSVNGSLAVYPDCDSVPPVKLASWTDRLANAARFTEVKSEGGLATSCSIAAQSWEAQAVR